MSDQTRDVLLRCADAGLAAASEQPTAAPVEPVTESCVWTRGDYEQEIATLRADLARVQQERDQAQERAEQAVKHQNGNAYAAVVLKELLEAARSALDAIQSPLAIDGENHMAAVYLARRILAQPPAPVRADEPAITARVCPLCSKDSPVGDIIHWNGEPCPAVRAEKEQP